MLANKAEPYPDTPFLLNLILVCKDFRLWVEPSLYAYIELSDRHPPELVFASILARGTHPLTPDSIDERLKSMLRRSPPTKALSFPSQGEGLTLDSKLDLIFLFLRHLERISIPLSLLGDFDRLKLPLVLSAHDMTIVMDRNPLRFDYQDAAQRIEWRSSQGKRFRFTRPPFDLQTQSLPDVGPFYDEFFLDGCITHIAIETFLDSSTPPIHDHFVQHTIAPRLCALPHLKRLVIICWVDGEQTELFKAPPIIARENAQDKVVIVSVPVENRPRWTFHSLERRGLNFWDEVERVGVNPRARS